MHKKYNKYGKKESLYKTSSIKKTHVKHKKENNDSLNELIKVPQNSKCEIKNYHGDIENTENFKLRQKYKDKYKQKKSERNKSTEHHSKKREKQSNHNVHKSDSVLVQNERPVKHKENYAKKEKRDKERLNNIEKYLEGLNEVSLKGRGRNRSSLSLRSTENVENRMKHIRREKTFHGETSRKRDPPELNPIPSETKRLRDQKRKEKEAKKQKHRENKVKNPNKEKEKRENSPKQLFYCQIDNNNPLEKIEKNRETEKHSSQLYKYRKLKTLNKIRRHSPSKGRSTSPHDDIKMKLERSNRNRDRSSGHSKEKRAVEQSKHSQRKAKRKDNEKSTKEPKSKVNLGPYDKYFVVDKTEPENENKQHRKWRRGKNKENLKKAKNDNATEKQEKEERKHKKKSPEKKSSKVKENTLASTQDEFREKIEDDIKSYFTKIQTLIDKKLEFILHGSSGENKINDNGKEISADATPSKKRKRSESKEEKHARHRSKSMKKHRSRKHDNSGNPNNEEIKRNHKSHTSMTKEERKLHNEELKRQRHHKSPTKFDTENLGLPVRPESNEREPRHHKRHNSPQLDFHETVIPSHLVNMIEKPSAYSMKSKKSRSGDKIVVKEMNSEVKLRAKHTHHKVIFNENDQNKVHRESSLARKNVVPEEVTCAGIANDFCSEDLGPPVENHGKKSKRRPLNLECKTISIIGIPSQIKESIIFNETQTTTSLNINNSVEDPVEKKKKTKRFKLYYKYSLANNSCARSDSDRSSDGKSIVSDSYRVVSGNSEHNSEVCLNKVEWDPPKESRKIVFVMKRESLANISGDTSDNQIAIEQFSRKCRKQRSVTPDASKLNNIVEEPSNMSCLEELDKTLQSMNSGLHCKYFNILNSSSSACNLHLVKKTTISDWNIPIGRCKCRIFENSDKIATLKIPDKKTYKKEDPLENKSVRNIDNQRNEKTQKKVKNKRIQYSGQKYTSKSDIDISYDSLNVDRNYKNKLYKNKRKVNLSSHLIENSTYTPEIYIVKKPSNTPDKHHLQDDFVRADQTELKVKESVCQTESEMYKEAIEDLIITKACKKYFSNMLESHHSHKQDIVISESEDMNIEAKISQSRKKGVNLEVTRIPSLLNKRRVEKPTPPPEINTPAIDIAQDSSQKPFKRSLIPERINRRPGFSSNKSFEFVTADEKLKRQAQNSPKGKKSPLKTPDDAVYVRVTTSKRNFNNGMGRNTENIEKPTGFLEPQSPHTPKQNSQINRENIEKFAGFVEVKKPLTPKKNCQINRENTEKFVGFVDAKRPLTPKQNCQINRENIEKFAGFVEAKKSLTTKQNNQMNRESVEKFPGFVEAKRLTPKQNSRINRDNRDQPNKRSRSQQSKKSASSQRSKTPSSRPTEVISPVKIPAHPKVPTSVVSGRTKVLNITRPLSAREKSLNEEDLLRTTEHEVKRSASATDNIEKPSLTNNKKKPRLVVKCTKVRDIPVKKCIAINTSRLTVPGSNKKQKQTQSNSCSYKSRKSNKYVGLTSHQSNFSFCDMNTESEQSKITSLVCLNKFMCDSKIISNSNSQACSLDQYTTKSITDQCHSSRLFLTKDYIPQLNTYQRRKLYSEGLRKKMKRNQMQNVIAPQIFEVRYLTYEKQTLKDGSEATPYSSPAFDSNKFYTTKFSSTAKEYFRKKASPRTPGKKSRKHANRSKDNAIKFSSRNPFPTIINDVDSLSKYRKRKFPEVKIEDIFIKGNKIDKKKEPNSPDVCKQLTNVQSSSIIIKDDTSSFNQLKSLSHTSTVKFQQNFNSEAKFMHLVDYLCKSIVGHCSSDLNLSQEDCQEPPIKSESINNIEQLVDVNTPNDPDAQDHEKLSTIEDSSVNLETSADEKKPEDKSDEDEACSLAAEPINCVSPENTKCIEKLSNDRHKVLSSPLVSGHVSCPALAGTASSFEFLYEDESKELSKQTILESLAKPLDTILGYALHCNDTVIIRKEAYTSMGNKIDQISNSPTDSGESGYSSNSSRKCSSASSFFKKPYVAALFKSPPIFEVLPQNKDSKQFLMESNQSFRMARYDLMSKECHEYAQKVRIQSEGREELEGTFQEIPLNVLLQRKSSTILGQCNSDCSICNEYADEREALKTDFAPSENVVSSSLNSRAFLEEESFDTSEQNEDKLETLIYYGNSKCKPSLEMITSEQSKTDPADVGEYNTLEQELNECPMVVSNTNLHKCSLTLIDRRQSKDSIKEEKEESSSNNSKTNYTEQEAVPGVSSSNLCSVKDPTESTTNVETAKGNDEAITDDDVEDTVVSSNIVSTFSISTSATKKLMAKKFFENLLRVYEKELAVTTRLFQDDDFFVNDLLSFVNEAEEKEKRKGKLKKIIKGKIRGYLENVFTSKTNPEIQSLCSYNTEQSVAKFETISQRNLRVLAFNAKKYFSMYVQAVTANKNINDEIKICGLLKILQRIENGDFTILRTDEEVNFESEIKNQVKEAFINIYEISVKEAKKHKRSLTIDDLKLIKAFVSKYRIGLLSKTDIIATYIGRGIFKTEKHLSAAVTYLIRIQSEEVDLKEFEEYCKVYTYTKSEE